MTSTQLPDYMEIQDGVLHMEGVDLREAALEVETPGFLISRKKLASNVDRYLNAFQSQWPYGEFLLMPAFKACPLLAVRKILNELGCGCDIFGPGELHGALRAGVLPEKISVNGSIKDARLLRTAISAGARIVLDSPRELELVNELALEIGTVADILFRPKPYLNDLDAKSDFLPDMEIRELTQIIKYGIPASELAAMGPRSLELSGVKPVGVHVHMGRHSKTELVWRAWTKHTVEQIKALSVSMNGWRPDIIDLGGGIASFADRDPDVTVTGYSAPSLEEIAASICNELANSLRDSGIDPEGIRLELEPGRGLHADTGVHLTRVCNVKEETTNIRRKWLELDTSEVFLGIGGINFSPPFDVLAVEKAGQALTETVDMVGKTCNAEMLFMQVSMPHLKQGEHIVLLNTGSYIEPMAANFNALPRPGTWLVDGAKLTLIKRPETVEDVYQRDILTD